MDRLRGKRALITGGTSGIGLETARQFLAQGARVIVTGRSQAGIARARQDLGGGALVVASDAGDVAEQQQLAARIAAAFGQLDVVFINAGVATLQPIERWDEPTLDRQLAVNFKGPYFLIQRLLPLLANPTAIVLMATADIHCGAPMSSVYSASKAALLSLAKTLSGELMDRGVRVNAISAGPLDTPLHWRLGAAAGAARQLQIPLGRLGEAREIAQAVVFLASDETAFMRGGEIIIDGGMSTL